MPRCLVAGNKLIFPARGVPPNIHFYPGYKETGDPWVFEKVCPFTEAVIDEKKCTSCGSNILEECKNTNEKCKRDCCGFNIAKMNVFLFGKGPSIDDFISLGPLKKNSDFYLCINESAYLIPEVDACIAIDYCVLDKYRKQLPNPNVLIFKKECHTQYEFPKEYQWCKGREVETLVATAPVAVQLLYYFGVRVITLVGFDSFISKEVIEYAQSVKAIDAVGLNRDGFASINREMQRLLTVLPGLTYIKWQNKIFEGCE